MSRPSCQAKPFFARRFSTTCSPIPTPRFAADGLAHVFLQLEDEDLTIDEIVTSLAALGMTVFVEGWLGVLFRHLLSEDLGTSFLTATFSLLLDKITVLAVRPNADDDDDDKDEELGTNDIANLLGNDIMKRFRDFLIASNLPMATAAFSGSLGTLLYVLGLPSLAGVGCMVVMTLVNLRIARKLGGIEATILKASDKRIGILTEIVASIKAVKFFAWERPYMDKLSAARTDEVTRIQRFRLWQVTSIAIGRAAPAISACAAIVTYALLGNPLRAGDIFATLAVFQGLRLALIVLPHALAAVQTLKVSLKRLQQFMDQEEAPERTPTAAAEGGVLVVEAATIGWPVTKTRVQRNEMKIVQSNSALKDLKACGVITDTEFDDISTRVTASILRNNIVLTGVSLRLKPGEIAAVVGKVGSGKSTLLSTIVGDVQCMSGVLRSAGSLGYVPQRAVIVSGSVRENILFGRAYSTELLNAALYASDFVHDVKMLADGIDTEIGERGTTLSGGQQQRLSIARAVYGKPQLLVLDDPLSAVDPEVCNRIFNRTILALKGSGQSVIIACSQVHLLPHFDHILHLQGGAVSEQGSYSELLALGGSVASLVNEHAHEQGSNKPPAGDAETHNASASMKQSSDFAEASALKHKKQHTSRKGEARQTGTMKNSVPVAYFTAMGWCLFAAIIAIITMAYGKSLATFPKKRIIFADARDAARCLLLRCPGRPSRRGCPHRFDGGHTLRDHGLQRHVADDLDPKGCRVWAFGQGRAANVGKPVLRRHLHRRLCGQHLKMRAPAIARFDGRFRLLHARPSPRAPLHVLLLDGAARLKVAGTHARVCRARKV